MTALMEEKDLYLASFSRQEKELKDSGPGWLHALRQSAIDRFAALGFPTLDDEEWRFTNLASLTSVPFELHLRLEPGCILCDSDTPPSRVCILTVGHRPVMLPTAAKLPDGIIIKGLADAVLEHPQLVQPHLARWADCDEHAFTALNTAFLQDGVFIYLPKGTVVEPPISLQFDGYKTAKPCIWQRRVLIIAESNTHAQIIERYWHLEREGYFTNAVTEIVLGDGATLEHVKLQEEGSEAFHIHTIQVQQGRSSSFTSHNFAFGGKLARTEINAVLDGEGSECTLNGLYLAAGAQLIDNHTVIEHVRPHCTSHELYKGILDGNAHGVWGGKIHVHPDAQKTDAKQTNQTLLLSDEATINTKPQLEIYADDVKCTHGATVGQLDAEAIFYLRSRGLGQDEARSLLTYAFANDVIGRVTIESLRAELEKKLHDGERAASAVRA